MGDHVVGPQVSTDQLDDLFPQGGRLPSFGLCGAISIYLDGKERSRRTSGDGSRNSGTHGVGEFISRRRKGGAGSSGGTFQRETWGDRKQKRLAL